MAQVPKTTNYKMKKKCSVCGAVSNSVERSKKYKQLLCLDCLMTKIIDQK